VVMTIVSDDYLLPPAAETIHPWPDRRSKGSLVKPFVIILTSRSLISSLLLLGAMTPFIL